MPRFLVMEEFALETSKPAKDLHGEVFRQLKAVSKEPYFKVLSAMEPVKGKVVQVHCHVQAPDIEEAFTWHSRIVSQTFLRMGIRAKSRSFSIVPEVL